MGQNIINGAKYAFGTVIGANVAITSISNANPAVITGTAPTLHDVILLTSGWTDLNDLVTYAGTAGVLSNVDTTDTSRYVAGESAGHYNVVSGFTSLSQIRDIAQSGGTMNTFSWGYVDDRSSRQRSRPTDRAPIELTFTLDYDPDLPWVTALDTVSQKKMMTVMRETLPNGDVLLYSGYIGYQKSPTRVRNENMTVSAVMTINSEVMRFPASFFA